jgi:UDP-N-acetylglucosamine 2-epimerase (non-hydrolysing)
LTEAGAAASFIAAAERGFGFVTLHRLSKVDDPEALKELLEVLGHISKKLCLVFPLHPRTKGVVAVDLKHSSSQSIFWPRHPQPSRARGLMREARLAITDSGGVQKETTALGVPRLPVCDNAERPTTIDEGTNTLGGHLPRYEQRHSPRCALKSGSALFKLEPRSATEHQPAGRRCACQ